MKKQMSKEEYIKLRKKAHNIAMGMMEHLEGKNTSEILCASMTIIVFILSTNSESKEDAYNGMSELFSIGDKMLAEAEFAKVTAWNGWKDK